MKNAQLARSYGKYGGEKGKSGKQNWWQRVPAFQQQDFQNWAKTVHEVMRPGQDLAWILDGKSRTNGRQIESKITKLKWVWKAITIVYDPRTCQGTWWTRERGFPNSANTETLYVCWRGRTPKVFPQNRMHVDVGSRTYLNVIRTCLLLRWQTSRTSPATRIKTS